MKSITSSIRITAIAASLVFASGSASASSHMDAPLITLDPAANTTDLYAFVDQDENGEKNLVVALGVYPFEEPCIGPNKYNFDDDVRYAIHIALGDDVRKGRRTMSYRFEFDTKYKNENTILQSYLGVVNDVDDANQNLTQTYKITLDDRRSGHSRHSTVGNGVVPPNNQGIATPFYNQGDDGENPAKGGVATEAELDRYTAQSVFEFDKGYRAFAGQRDDGFYGDIQAIFDLLQLRADAKDSQGGFNLHMMALEIPLDQIGGDQQIVGVYATTERLQHRILRQKGDKNRGQHIQVGRQGNPLFNEALVAIADKDLYSRTRAKNDKRLFTKYAETPELAALLNALVVPGTGLNPAQESGRDDLVAIYIPDLIKVDLSTGPARLAGGGADHPTNPDDDGFSSLGVFGGDVLTSSVQDGLPGFPQGTIPGGWPNGRRFGDDVIDIAVTAVLSTLPPLALVVQGPAGDGVNQNDMVYNKVFPYESTPQNGRNHRHHGDVADMQDL